MGLQRRARSKDAQWLTLIQTDSALQHSFPGSRHFRLRPLMRPGLISRDSDSTKWLPTHRRIMPFRRLKSRTRSQVLATAFVTARRKEAGALAFLRKTPSLFAT